MNQPKEDLRNWLEEKKAITPGGRVMPGAWESYKGHDLYNPVKLQGQQLPPKANDKQISGTHYKQFKGYEPWDVIIAWNLDYLTGSAVKYLARWKHKGGVDDIKKAIHFLEKLVEEEEKKSGVRHPTGPIEAY